MKMIFERPGMNFYEGFPMGNGRLGATVLGGIEEETVILNESSVWSGSFEESDNPKAVKYLPEIRRLLAEGKVPEAEKLFGAHFTCSGKGSGYGNAANLPFGCYQVLGKLRLTFFEGTPFRSNGLEWLDSYARELDLERAVASVRFQSQQRQFLREAFVSAPDEVFAMRLSASQSREISLIAALDRTENSETKELSEDSLLLSGSLPDGKGGDGVSFACILKAVCKGGRVFTKQGKLFIEGAEEALLLITAQTDLKGIVGRGNSNALEAARLDMEKASAYSWQELISRHETYFRPLAARSSFHLEGAEEKPVPQLREEALKKGGSVSYDQLFYEYSKYLFISSSRPGEIPANLQGIWAEEIHTPWNGDWHFNAQQMLYWPAEVWNLSELHTPYLDLIKALQEPGQKTAKAYYGARGWVVHTFTNPWGFTSPGEDASWGSTTGSAAWLCQHLWDHYLYTGDRAYLEKAYPVLRGAAEFYLDMLAEEPEHGWLVTSPSDSPENRYYTEKGEDCALCMGPTYDSQLVRYLFKALLAASGELGIWDPLTDDVEQKLKRLAPTRLGSDGRIMEWLKEYREPLPYHRHTSHLWGLYPGDEITVEKTPELAEGAAKTLKERKDISAEWALAFRACLYAHLQDRKNAYAMVEKVLIHTTFPNLLGKCHHAPENMQPARVPRYEDLHFPFQMDGDMGILAAYAEMLVQSAAEWKEGEFCYSATLLPALPEVWKTGSAQGIRIRGGFTVNLDWEEGKMSRLCVSGKGAVQLYYGGKARKVVLDGTEPLVLDGKEIDRWNGI